MKRRYIISLVIFCSGIFAYHTHAAVSITSENAKTLLVDKDASPDVVELFYKLSQTAQQGVIVGQQCAYSSNEDDNVKKFIKDSEIYGTTNYSPMVSGEDLWYLTDDKLANNNWYDKNVQGIKQSVIEAHKLGVFTSFSWHFREPYDGLHFYSKELSEDVKNKAFKSILEGGENHLYYKNKLDLIADFFLSLKDDDNKLIPVIFRPFHEMEASWFWWGIPHYATAQEYKELWQFTVEYLCDVKGVHNVLYAFSPDKNFTTQSQYLTCYPGDAYVDILGFDSYEDYSKGESARTKTVNQLRIIDALAKEKGKIAALTECGYDYKEKGEIKNLYSQHYYSILEDAGANISYMMFWEGFLPTTENDTQELTDDLSTFFGKELILTMEDFDDSTDPDNDQPDASPAELGFEVASTSSNVGASGWKEDLTTPTTYLARTTTQFYQGSASMQVNVPASNSTLGELKLKNILNYETCTTGDKYKVSCYVYVEAGKNAKLKSIQFALSGDGWAANEAVKTSTTNAWVKLESEISLAGKTAGNYAPFIKIYLNKTTNTELKMYIDNVSVSKVEDDITTQHTQPAANKERIFARQGGICINNCEAGTLVAVYNLAGVQMLQTTVDAAESFIPLERGVYIVKVNNTVEKIML